MMTLCLNKSPLREVFRQTKAKKGAELNPKKNPPASQIFQGASRSRSASPKVGFFWGSAFLLGGWEAVNELAKNGPMAQ